MRDRSTFTIDEAAVFLSRGSMTAWSGRDVLRAACAGHLRIFGRADRDAEVVARDGAGCIVGFGTVTRGALYPLTPLNAEQLLNGPDAYMVDVLGDDGCTCRVESDDARPIVTVDGCRIRETDLLALLPFLRSADDEAPAAPPAAVPRQRQPTQETAILSTLVGLGIDPRRLPKGAAGRPGVKRKVLELLRESPSTRGMFQGTVFNKAWERLRRSGELADAA